MSLHGRVQSVTRQQVVSMTKDTWGVLGGSKMESRLDQMGRQPRLGRPRRLFQQERGHCFGSWGRVRLPAPQ